MMLPFSSSPTDSVTSIHSKKGQMSLEKQKTSAQFSALSNFRNPVFHVSPDKYGDPRKVLPINLADTGPEESAFCQEVESHKDRLICRWNGRMSG